MMQGKRSLSLTVNNELNVVLFDVKVLEIGPVCYAVCVWKHDRSY